MQESVCDKHQSVTKGQTGQGSSPFSRMTAPTRELWGGRLFHPLALTCCGPAGWPRVLPRSATLAPPGQESSSRPGPAHGCRHHHILSPLLHSCTIAVIKLSNEIHNSASPGKKPGRQVRAGLPRILMPAPMPAPGLNVGQTMEGGEVFGSRQV